MYSSQDFKSDQEVRWCPGCGDHAILATVQRVLPEVSEATGQPKENFVFISGIGCSSRLPYYMSVYGMHTIHGRATAIATGVRVANPKLSVWQVTGDGDALAIGGNHFIHAIRRNIDLNILLFNNEIYGLTKGQYSPTSKLGLVTKTSPYGTVERPFNPGELVIGATGTFFARAIDVDLKLSAECMKAAALHAGCAVVELLQNCVIFNDGTHSAFTAKELRDDKTITLRHGEPMIFGRDRDKGIVLDGLRLKAVRVGEGGVAEKDLLVHNAHEDDRAVHMLLAAMRGPELPLALGVIRAVKEPTYNQRVVEQVEQVMSRRTITCMDELLHSGETWQVA
ncbi:MAG: 2-oxoacid:ferredoxin oxidoreductase subunit beta [Prevotellaceae bacterium]|jgi:2-oxoglutarate ferredoxin oxidoreductase subunit beta|nr:2-oxoacid:ferredoxin oxidoreductase subunit beta [Prevotellaceae bacterium]